MYMTPRMERIASFVSHDAVVADIGTDHAYIPVYLIKNRICKTIYATDINTGPLDIASKQVEKYGYQDNIIILLGDGLSPIRDLKVDNIIIAGMGGILISKIIAQNIDIAYSAKKLILQPMTAQYELRKYLISNGFEITEEDLVKEDDHIYQVIVVRQGREKITNDDISYYFGPRLIEDKQHPLLLELIEAKEKKLKNIIETCRDKDSVNAINKYSECRGLLYKIEEVKSCL